MQQRHVTSGVRQQIVSSRQTAVTAANDGVDMISNLLFSGALPFVRRFLRTYGIIRTRTGSPAARMRACCTLRSALSLRASRRGTGMLTGRPVVLSRFAGLV